MKEKLGLAELKNRAVGFDRAEMRDVHVIKGAEDYLSPRHMGVWNLDKNELACLAPKSYCAIQHRFAVESVIDALASLNIRAEAELAVSKHGIHVDFDFPDAKVELADVGESFTSGIHLESDYSKVEGLVISPRLTRLACSNGMIVTEIVKSKRIKYTEQLKITVEGLIDKMIKDVIASDEKLANMVSVCMRDSVEWQTARLLAKQLFKRKKYVREVIARVKMDGEGRLNRWSFYNAITEFVTQSRGRLRPAVESWFQNKAQKVLTTSFPKLTEELVKVESPRDKDASLV